MIVVNRKTFLSLPENTLFSKFKPCYFGDLCIKGETMGDDFLVQQIKDAIDAYDSIEFMKMCFAAEEGEVIHLNFECEGRDALFEEDQLFAVWEPEDVRLLIKRLQRCVKY